MRTIDREQSLWWQRRFIQQALWTADLRRYLLARAGIKNARRVLEVGCGSGATLTDLDMRGDGNAHAIDLSIEFLKLAQENISAVDLVQADGHHLPYSDLTFEIVYCHFLLLWVADPQWVVNEMTRLTTPGGAVLILAEPDYGGRIDYPEVLSDLGRLQEEALRRQGAETRLGRQLGSILNKAGLEKVETGVLGGQWQGHPDLSEFTSEWDVMQADLAGSLAPQELERLRRLDYVAWQNGERTLFVPTFYGWGRKPETGE